MVTNSNKIIVVFCKVFVDAVGMVIVVLKLLTCGMLCFAAWVVLCVIAHFADQIILRW